MYKIEKYIYGSIVGLILLLLVSVPSIDFIPIWNPTVSNKTVLFIFILLPIFFLATWFIIFYTKRIVLSYIDVMFLLILICITVERFVIQAHFGFSLRYIELVGLFIFYFILRLVKKPGLFVVALIALVIGADIQILEGNLQLYGLINSNNSLIKVTGSFFNSGPYAGYLASVFPISLYLIKDNQFSLLLRQYLPKLKFNENFTLLIKYLILFNLIGTLIMLPILKSRACFIAIFLSAIFIYHNQIILFFKRYFFTNTLYKYVLVFFIVFVFLFGLIFMFQVKQGSTNGRSLILIVSSKMLKDKPIIGFGYDRFKAEYMNYQSAYFKDHPKSKYSVYADNVYYAFNDLLQFVVENGIIALSFCIAFICMLIYKLRQFGLFLAAAGGLISIFIFSLFSYSSEILPIKINLFLYLGILGWNYNKILNFNINIPQLKVFKFGLIFGSLILLSIGEASNFKLFQAYAIWNNAFKKYSQNEFTKSSNEYEKIYPFFHDEGEFMINWGKAAFFSKRYSDVISILKKGSLNISNTILETTLGDTYRILNDRNNAEVAYKNALYMAPSRFYTRYLLLSLYKDTQQKSKAIAMAYEILLLKTKINSQATDSIKSEAKSYLISNNITQPK